MSWRRQIEGVQGCGDGAATAAPPVRLISLAPDPLPARLSAVAFGELDDDVDPWRRPA